MTHTKGPWAAHWFETNKRTHTGHWYFVGQDEGQFEGHTKNVNLNSKNNVGEANARLIAAAPDLLAAARDALQSLRRLKHPDEDNSHEIVTEPESGYAYRVTCIAQLEQAIAKAEGVK